MALKLSLESYSSLALVLPFIFILFILKARNKRISLNPPPGPIHLPILGDMHRIDRALPHRSLFQLSRKYGPIMQLQLGLKPTVVISSARMASEIFKFHDPAFSHRPPLVSNKMLSYDFLDVAFSPHNGEYRKNMRKIMVTNLLNTKMVRQFRPTREAEVWQMISSVCTYTPSQPLNLLELVKTAVENIVFTSALGRGMGGTEKEKAEIHRVTQQGVDVLNLFFVEDFVPWLWWLDVVGGLYAKLKKAFEDLDDFYERVIEEHLDPMSRKQDNEDYVDVLLRTMKESNLTRDHVKGVLMNILFAATDSTIAVIVWGIAELVRNRREMKKCQEEIRRIVGKRGKVDEDDLSQLEYLKFVVKETMRLHPPGTIFARECAEQCKIDGYDIFPGTFIIVNAWAIGRDTEVWDRPNEFLPERFLNSLIDYKGNDFGLIPFGAGRRGCPGYHFAPPTIELALANLLYRFDWELPAGESKENGDIAEMIALVTLPKFNLYVPIKHDYA